MTRYVFKSLAILTILLATTNAAFADSSLNYTVSMGEAITKGLQANVTVLTAGAKVEEADGSRQRRLSAYLPHIHIETPIAYQTRNLKAQGISFPNTPSIVGPFTSYDFRVYGDQTILDLQSYHSIKASEKDQTARTNDYEETRSQVIRLVAVNYIVAEYAAAKVETAESVVRTSETLEKLAKNQREVGVADGLDVLRAQVQLANDRQSLLVMKNSYQKSLLVLARSIGVDLATRLGLSDRLVFKKLEAPQIEQAVQNALESRPDYRSLFSQRESLEEQLKSSRSRYLPKIIVSGNYGGSGQEISAIEPSYMVQANLVMTLFDLDRKGERQELESRFKRVEQQIADQRLGVEQDIRETLLNLDSADEQVVVAEGGLELAEQELQFASDRFKNGVVNNIEVVKAQDSLSRALDNKLSALAQHTEAKIALAKALGTTEKVYRLFLGIQ